MALGTNYARSCRPPKAGKCQISVVSQGRCYRSGTVKIDMGHKNGPLCFCEKCAKYILDVCPVSAKLVK
jgi:hypothetical protein